MNAPEPRHQSPRRSPAVHRSLRERLIDFFRAFRGPSYWAARVSLLDRGAGPPIERALRSLPGVSAAWVTPAISGGALISIRYDARRITPAEFVAVLGPAAHSLSPIGPGTPGVPSPEDRCVC